QVELRMRSVHADADFLASQLGAHIHHQQIELCVRTYLRLDLAKVIDVFRLLLKNDPEDLGTIGHFKFRDRRDQRLAVTRLTLDDERLGTLACPYDKTRMDVTTRMHVLQLDGLCDLGTGCDVEREADGDKSSIDGTNRVDRSGDTDALGQTTVSQSACQRRNRNAGKYRMGRACKDRQHHRAFKKCGLCRGSCRLREGRYRGQAPAQVRVVPGFDTSRRQTTANQIGCRLALRLY